MGEQERPGRIVTPCHHPDPQMWQCVHPTHRAVHPPLCCNPGKPSQLVSQCLSLSPSLLLDLFTSLTGLLGTCSIRPRAPLKFYTDGSMKKAQEQEDINKWEMSTLAENIPVWWEKTFVLFSVLSVEQHLTRPLLGFSSLVIQGETFLPYQRRCFLADRRAAHTRAAAETAHQSSNKAAVVL